jgi:hypothetical protein
MRTLVLSLALTPVLDEVADLASRPLLGVVASRTLWGTLATRMIAWCLAWYVTKPADVPSAGRTR